MKKVNINVNDIKIQSYINTNNPINLNNEVNDAECIEILADNVLDYIPTDIMYKTLEHYVSKLRHGGKLIIGGTDLILLSKDIVTQKLDLVKANKILYGEKVKKLGQISMFDLVELLKNLRLKITRKQFNGINFVVEGVRE